MVACLKALRCGTTCNNRTYQDCSHGTPDAFYRAVPYAPLGFRVVQIVDGRVKMASICNWKRNLERLTLTMACAISFAILAVCADSMAEPWTQVATTGPTSPRSNHGLAYDSARAKTVLFGGYVEGGPAAGPAGDTWEWDGSTWTQVATTGPSPRRPISLAYDSARGKTVLFGGWDGVTSLSDTWEWNGSTWTQVATTGPSPRQTSLAYDSARGVTVLFGGYPAPGDTWEFSGAVHNGPPILEAIPDQAAYEGTLLQFTVKASDPDNNILTCSASDLPAGAAFDNESAVFSWMPNYDQGGTTYAVTFSVTDGIASVSQRALINVGNVNRSPVLTPIGPKVAREGELLSFVMTAADPDGDSLTYSAANLPEGAGFDPATQAFSWAPNYGQGNRSYTDIEFSVLDGQGGVDSELISITVNNVNRPPEFTGVCPQYRGQASQPITFKVSASDPDGDSIQYSVDGLPAGASFDAASGSFFWTPSLGQAGNIYTVMFHASDGDTTTDLGVCISVQAPTPSQLANVIVQSINNLKLPREARNSLIANTKKVGVFIESGRVIAAINQLDALIDKVEREIARGIITEADGSYLIQAATYLKDKLRGSWALIGSNGQPSSAPAAPTPAP